MFPEGRALEFLLAAVVALVVVGPKDLPILLRKLGQFMAKMRAMAAEFRASFDEMARQSELEELRKEVEAMRKAQFADVADKAGAAEVRDVFDGIQQDLSGVTLDPEAQSVPPPYVPQPEAAVDPEAKPAPKPRVRRKAASVASEGEAAPAPKPRARKKAEPKA